MQSGLRQGCVLAPLLFNIFFTAVINKRDFHAFQGGQDIIMEALVHLRKKTGAGGTGRGNQRRVGPGDVALGYA